MAEAVARRELASLGWTHVEVRSAGTAAAEGAPASAGAVRAAAGSGLDLSAHRSARLTTDALEWADLVLAMSAGHLVRIVEMGSGDKATLLTSFAAAGDSREVPDSVPDPFGGTDEEYEATLQVLERLVERALRRLAPIVAP